MNIYIMRHGTTVWNEKGIIQGRSKNRLSQSGKQGVEQSANKHKNTPIDIIYCSPMMRTIQTANIFNKCHNVKLIKDDRLMEIDEGDFTKCDMNLMTDNEIKACYARSGRYKMESYESVYKRIKNFVDDIKANCKYENILVVTHNYHASMMEGILLGESMDFTDYNKLIRFANAEVKKFTI